ncbi:TPA: hypothetical protein O7139_005587, partial [Salmonella enterica]|nr:hypothetical protein [Salmonella enterica]
ERLSSYLDTIDESRRDNVHDFLSQTLNNPDGRGVVRISDLVEKRVDEGWRIKKDNDGKPVRLAGPDGESLSAGDITRYGLEYAEHISKLNRKAAEKSGEKID